MSILSRGGKRQLLPNLEINPDYDDAKTPHLWTFPSRAGQSVETPASWKHACEGSRSNEDLSVLRSGTCGSPREEVLA